MALPLVSVLIVTWNRKDDVLETVRSVYSQAYRNIEIIVVDNGSTDGTADALHAAYPAARIIALENNTGIAGRNAGIAVAGGDVVFCLDSDASPGSEALANIVRRFWTDPKLGVINSKVVNAYSGKIDHTAGWVYTEKDKADQDLEFLSYSFSEGGCAIRKEVFDKVGLFWEALFFGGEGLEFSLRVWDAGYKVLYYPESIVYHRASSTNRVSGSERDCLFLRNALYIYLVRYPLWMLFLFAPLKIAAALVRGARRGYLLQTLRALIEVLQKLPTLSSQRRPIRNETACTYLGLQRQHGPLRWSLVSWAKYKT